MVRNTEQLIEHLVEDNPKALTIDGCDTCLIGIGAQHGSPLLAIYSYDKLVDHFYEEFLDYETEEDAYVMAVEWVDHNVVSAYLGEGTPIILHD